MNLTIIYQILKADLLERSRKFSFFVLCAAAIFFAFFSIPDIEAPFVSIAIEPNVFRQGTNPSWIPITIALCGGILFPIIGLSYIKNNISVDRNTGLLYLMQSMNMKKTNYMIGKFFSNLLVLTFMWILVIVSAIVMIFIQFPNQQIGFYDFISPFLSLYPGILFVAAFSIFLESISLLSNKFGNAIGITILFVIFLINYINSSSESFLFRIFDFSSYRWVMDSINNSVIPIIGRSVQETGILVPGGMFAESIGKQELIFQGLIMSDSYIIDKIILIIVSFFLLLLSIIQLESGEQKQVGKVKKSKFFYEKKIHRNYNTQLISELQIMFQDVSKYWCIVFFCLWTSTIFVPLKYAQGYIWVLLLILSVPIFSQMGCREYEYGLTDYFVTIKSALLKQIVYSYVCGVIFLFTITSPIIMRMLITHNYVSCMSYFLFSLFIPAIACFLGEYAKSRRAFETIYLLLCFLLINAPAFLFIGYVNMIMGVGTISLCSLTWIRRKRV